MNESINEYRKAFNMPFLSDKLLYCIISKPQLVAIWRGNRTYHNKNSIRNSQCIVE